MLFVVYGLLLKVPVCGDLRFQSAKFCGKKETTPIAIGEE